MQSSLADIEAILSGKELTLHRLSADEGFIKVQCLAEGVYPLPLILLHSQRRNISETDIISRRRGQLFEVSATVTLPALEGPEVFSCKLHIPQANYTTRRETVFYPGEVLTEQIDQNKKDCTTTQQKEILSSCVSGPLINKYKLVEATKRLATKYYQRKVTSKSKGINLNKRQRASITMKLKERVGAFPENDSNYICTPGKKDKATKDGTVKQRRYLTDTLLNMYIKFRQENYNVNEENISSIDTAFDQKNIKPLPKMMQLHQVTWEKANKNVLNLRELSSCQCKEICLHNSIFPNQCQMNDMRMCWVSLTKVEIFLYVIILDNKTVEESVVADVAKDSPKKEGHWVTVVFNSEWFPRQILRVEGSNLVISFMRKSLPQKMDV
ncbi:unnamed protein product [Psylliodes chrysocephalus]|uniref:Uncharacterized protein n=1 Tax=Psylliodes chrysocephalus TaxID=3402493 RepID=A0A9P0GJ83_9CUCU|nr:unnamed protein product [Psylliodes chrysocephala]